MSIDYIWWNTQDYVQVTPVYLPFMFPFEDGPPGARAFPTALDPLAAGDCQFACNEICSA